MFDHSRFGGMGCWFVKSTLLWNMTCQGFKNDVDVGDNMTDEEVLAFVRSISLKWMREHDPHGDRW